MIKTVIALAVVAGFASASFAQGAAATAPAGQTAPTAKVAAPAAGIIEKKVEAPKAAEPVKAEVVHAATPAKSVKEHHQKHEKHAMTTVKTEAPAPTTK